MAIARDTSTSTFPTSTGTSHTTSFTCTGSNLMLLVFVLDGSDLVTGVTYNGVSMTLAYTANVSGSTERVKLFTLGNPSTGANNIVVTSSGANTTYIAASSYTGALLSIGPATTDTFAAVASPKTESVTTIDDNSWTVMFFRSTTGTITASTGSTFRGSDNGSDGRNMGLYDSNAALTPAGSKSMSVTSGGTMTGGAIIVAIAPAGSSRYWVGGTANWDSSTTANWSATSGGAGGASVPDATANVFFNASSSGTSTITATASCNNLDMTGFTGTLAVSSTLNVSGNLSLSSGMTLSGSSAMNLAGNITLAGTITYTGAITFTATASGKSITSAGKTLASTITFNGVGGGWTLQDAFVTTGAITLTNGNLNFGGFNVTAPSFSSSNSNTRVLTLGAGTITLNGTGTVWNIGTSTGLTLTANTSVIKITDASASSKTFSGGGMTYYNLWITGSGTGAYTIVGSNTFNDFKVDTPPHTVNFTAGTRQTVSTFTVNGTAGNLMTLQSTSAGTQWKLASNNVISCDYLSLQDSRAEHV